ncbi:MAG: DnaB-like helicase C-terminal domain-containing protein, partial [Clostridia bacterium]|nr:DnaB-like helicase C-terminal domain-containing protein [Clostridia bacterium]
TSLALNIASHVAIKEQKGVAIFSLEMSGEQLVSRMISALALVDSYRLRTGEIRPDEWTRLAEAVSILGDAPVKIDDNAGVTVQEIKAKLRREKNIGLVIIDYLQLMRSGIRSDNRAQEVAEISRSLKIMARELDIPVIALSQLNRASESRKDKKPMLSDLRESGSIEQDADIVIFLYRDDDNPDLEARNIVNCSVAKNRHGATGSIDFLWNGQYTRFMTLETRHEPS